MILVRKISYGKWKDHEERILDEFDADAITSCLRTTDNTLSTWKIESEKEITDVYLAIATNSENISKMVLLKIDSEELTKQGLEFGNTESVTPHKSFSKRHYDITNLNYNKLGKVAVIIRNQINDEKNIYQKTKAQVMDLLLTRINNKEIDINDLNDKLRKEIDTYILKNNN